MTPCVPRPRSTAACLGSATLLWSGAAVRALVDLGLLPEEVSAAAAALECDRHRVAATAAARGGKGLTPMMASNIVRH